MSVAKPCTIAQQAIAIVLLTSAGCLEKALFDPFEQLSERFIFALARLGVAVKRDRVGPEHGLEMGWVTQGKLDIGAAHSFYGLDRFRASLIGSPHQRLSEP
jgi:hypothetical protein